MQPLAPGAVLFEGRFAIVRLIAHGGQATTYEGVDKREGQRVAIKRFVVRGASSWKDVELAEREARVLSGLSHPCVPRHIAHFEENGELYLVTEYIEGATLDALSKGLAFTPQGASDEHFQAVQAASRGRLSQADVVSYLFAIAELLDYLHSQSPPIIHRDIKPKNVIRRSDGSFVLVDFGSVRERMKPEGGSTVVGTFGYMAPEQFQGRALPATDTYAAAATALALLTGQDPDQLPHQGLKLDVDKALGSSVSNELKRVLKSALEPDPDRRAQRLSQLLKESSLRRNGVPADNTNDGHRRYSGTARSASADTDASPNSDASFDGAPFRTQGYQRPRSASEQVRIAERQARRAEHYAAKEERRARERAAKEQHRAWEQASRSERREHQRAERRQRREARRGYAGAHDQYPIIDIETPLKRALRLNDVQRVLSIPFVALVLTLLLVLARTMLWLGLGVVVPLLLVVIHRVFGAPVLDEARRSRHVARQLRTQMRHVTHTLREGAQAQERLADEAYDEQPSDTVAEPAVRFRVDADVPNTGGPNRAVPNTGVPNPERTSTVDFARQFDEEAYELESQLDEAVEKLGKK